MRDRLKSFGRGAARHAMIPVRWIGRSSRVMWGIRAELLHAATIVGGWALVTWGTIALLETVAQVLGIDLSLRPLWPISAGLFLLSLAGWAHLKALFGVGLYWTYRQSRGGG